MRALAPALAAAPPGACAPGSVVLTVAAAADGLPMHLVALYAPSGGLGLLIKLDPTLSLSLSLTLTLTPQVASAS